MREHPHWRTHRNMMVAFALCMFGIVATAVWSGSHGDLAPAADLMGHLCWSREVKEASERCSVACSEADAHVVTFAPACANGGRDHCKCAPGHLP